MDKTGDSSETEKGSAGVELCIVCREPIGLRAAKCKECGSFQDWTRHIFRWSGIVVAIVAVIPLWNIAVSLRQIAFTPQHAELGVLALACKSSGIKIAVANQGSRAGILDIPRLKIVRNGREETPQIDLLAQNLKEKDQTGIIKPGELYIFEYRGSVTGIENPLPLKSSPQEHCLYRLQFRVIPFELKLKPKSSKPLETTCECPI